MKRDNYRIFKKVVRKRYPQINVIAALEVDLDEDEALVVLAEDGLEEAAAAEHLLKHQIVGGRKVVKVVLRRRRLRRPGYLVTHLRHQRRSSANPSLGRKPRTNFSMESSDFYGKKIITLGTRKRSLHKNYQQWEERVIDRSLPVQDNGEVEEEEMALCGSSRTIRTVYLLVLYGLM